MLCMWQNGVLESAERVCTVVELLISRRQKVLRHKQHWQPLAPSRSLYSCSVRWMSAFACMHCRFKARGPSSSRGKPRPNVSSTHKRSEAAVQRQPTTVETVRVEPCGGGGRRALLGAGSNRGTTLNGALH